MVTLAFSTCLMAASITSPTVFVYVACIRQGTVTPHRVVRVLEERADEIELLLACRECGERLRYVTDALPEGLRTYAVRVVGEAGPDPLGGPPLPGFEEAFRTVGVSRQDAFERAQFGWEAPARGQLVLTFIDGEEHRDARY